MKDFIKYFDKVTFLILIFLVSIGIMIIYSASHGLSQSYHLKQILWLCISLIAFLIVFRMKSEVIFKSAIPIFIALVFVLFFQIIAGRIISGTRSWMKIGFLSVQFSEFIKIPLALLVAQMLAKSTIIDWKTFAKLLAVVGLPFMLIALQPDMGTAFILISVLLISVLLKRIRIWVLIISLLVGMAGAVLTWNYVLKPYQKERIRSFINPSQYKKSSGYQIIQSKIAIGSGGLYGKGYLKGSQSEYRFLPTQHTDFVFSVLGEELGFMGVTGLFFLFFVLFYRQLFFKTESASEFYFVCIFNGLIFFQFLINILMSIGLLPVLGIPLPFVSYGGSSLLAFFIGEGIIFRVRINSYIQ